MHGSLAKHMAKTGLNVNRLTATLFSKFGARLKQTKTGYKCKEGHVWIDHNMYNRTSLVNISRLCIERMVTAGLYSITMLQLQTWQK